MRDAHALQTSKTWVPHVNMLIWKLGMFNGRCWPAYAYNRGDAICWMTE